MNDEANDVATLLQAARLAVEGGDAALASDHLVRAWHAKKLPAIAELLASLDRRTAAPITGRTIREVEDSWHVVARDLSEVVLPGLLATVWPTSVRRAAARVAALTARPPSPRISHALMSLHIRRQYPSAAGCKLSRQIVRWLVVHEDPIVADHVARLEQGDPDVARTMRRTLALGLGPLPMLHPNDREQRELTSLTTITTPTSSPPTVELLAEVYARPLDDSPRSVLADHLIERGDLRGELIALQLADRPRSHARIGALIRGAGRTWWDGLERDGAVEVAFDRGFPGFVRTAQPIFVEAAWATVQGVLIQSPQPWLPRGLETLRSLRILWGIPATELANLALACPEDLVDLGLCGEGSLDVHTQPELSPVTITLSEINFEAAVRMAAQLAHVPLGRRTVDVSLWIPIDEALDAAILALEANWRLHMVNVLRDPGFVSPSWLARLTRDTLRLYWEGQGALEAEFRSIEDILRDVIRPPKVTSVQVAVATKLGARLLPELRPRLQAIIQDWPGSPPLIDLE